MKERGKSHRTKRKRDFSKQIFFCCNVPGWKYLMFVCIIIKLFSLQNWWFQLIFFKKKVGSYAFCMLKLFYLIIPCLQILLIFHPNDTMSSFCVCSRYFMRLILVMRKPFTPSVFCMIYSYLPLFFQNA